VHEEFRRVPRPRKVRKIDTYKYYRAKKVPSVIRAKAMEDNISSGRKIFRLLKFIDEVNELHVILKKEKWPIGLKIIKILSSVCSYFYFLFDNIVWLVSIGFIDKFIIHHVKWKKMKDFFSLWKTIFEVISSIYVVKLALQKEKILKQKLSAYNGRTVKPDTNGYAIMRQLILTMRKRRFQQIEIFIYSMRFIMLVSSLKLVGHRYLDPIFVSICGLLQAISVVFKSMASKKKFYKLTVEDVEKKGTNKNKILTHQEIMRDRALSNQINRIYGNLEGVERPIDSQIDELLFESMSIRQHPSSMTLEGAVSPD